MPLTMNRLEHEWRNPRHCAICDICRANRARINRESLADAHQTGKLFARDVGAPLDAAPIYQRLIRVPRSNQPVLIQLPHMSRPVAPSEPVPRSRKRRYIPVTPIRLTPQKRPYTTLQQEHSESEAEAPELHTPAPEPPRYTWSAVSSQRSRPNTPFIPVNPPERIEPIDPELRRYLLRPDPTSTQTWSVWTSPNPPSVAPKRDPYSMPGAWPSELDDEDVEASADKNMILPTRLGSNIYNAVSYLRDSSFNLYNKFFHPNQQSSATLTPTRQDDERSSKRRRLGAEEHCNAVPKAESASYTRPSPDSSSFGDPMDIDSVSLEKLDGLDVSPPLSPRHSSHSPIAMSTAKRAARLFPNSKKTWSKRTKVQMVTPPPEDEDGMSPPLEKPTTTTSSTYDRVWRPPPPPKYNNIHEFFDHDSEYGLPGLERLSLTPNSTKICELDSQRQERLRIEKEKAEKERRELLRIAEEKAEKERQERLRVEQEEANKKLSAFGLRKAKAALITPLSDEWDQKATEALHSGHTPEIKWQGSNHSDGVQLTPRDFSKLVPAGAWLNDNAIQAALLHLAIYINNAAGVVPKKSTPKCVAISSQYWSSYQSDKRAKLYPRGFSRTWGMRPDNFLDIDTVLVPVNRNSHWTVIVIRPSRRTISYLDSFYGQTSPHFRDARGWLEQFLGAKYVASDWSEEIYNIPRQSNGWDCGMFVITNSICVALGLDPYCYDEDDLPLQRRRIAAMLLNGGFTGPFDLSHL